MSDEYIAGFIDGEGCIYIHRQKSTGTNFERTHTACVRIVNEEDYGIREQAWQILKTLKTQYDVG